MAYVNLDPDFPTHPKCIRLQVKCGKNSHLLLIPLWCFAAKYHPEDGNLGSYSPEEIESFCAWAGDKQCFYNACVEIGFIDVKGDKKLLHDWKNHQGHIVAYKERSRLAAKTRWDKIHCNKKKYKGLGGDATSIAQDCSSNAKPIALNQALALPTLPTLPNKDSPDFLSRAKKLESFILQNNPKSNLSKNHILVWTNDVRLMVEMDHRTFVEIDSIINFSQKDNFWKRNILSMGKLREKFDQLWMQAQPKDKHTGIKVWLDKQRKDKQDGKI